MPLVEVVGKTGAALPLQKAGNAVKAGIVPEAVKVTVIVSGGVHCPVFDVNV